MGIQMGVSANASIEISINHKFWHIQQIAQLFCGRKWWVYRLESFTVCAGMPMVLSTRGATDQLHLGMKICLKKYFVANLEND